MPGLDIDTWPSIVGAVGRGKSVAAPIVVGDLRGRNDHPRVVNIIPPPGETVERAGALQFDVRDDWNIVRYWIAAYYAGHPDVREVVHDGSGFGPAFASGSSRTALFDGSRVAGSRFIIRRNGDWPAAPRLHIEAVDDGGNVSVLL